MKAIRLYLASPRHWIRWLTLDMRWYIRPYMHSRFQTETEFTFFMTSELTLVCTDGPIEQVKVKECAFGTCAVDYSILCVEYESQSLWISAFKAIGVDAAIWSCCEGWQVPSSHYIVLSCCSSFINVEIEKPWCIVVVESAERRCLIFTRAELESTVCQSFNLMEGIRSLDRNKNIFISRDSNRIHLK